jgi:hypothetical protein
MAVIKIKNENLQNLEKIQILVQIEEGQKISLEEALARVIAFYRRFVPL